MELNDDQLIRHVRDHTTDSQTLLPDSVILRMGALELDGGQNRLPSGTLDLMGVIADCWGYMARGDRYGSVAAGALAQSQPQARYWESYYRSKSAKGGVPITKGSKVRTDLIADPSEALAVTEFGAGP